MTQKTRSAVETEIASLLADNGTGAITAANVRTVVVDMCDSAIFPLSDTVTPLTLSGVLLSNGTGITTDTTTAHTATIQGYSTVAAGYVTLGTITNGTSATLALNAPTNGVLTIDNAAIGNTTPAAGHFTTVSSTGLATLATATVTGTLTASALIAGSVATSLTAVGTTQGTALALTKAINNVTTVAASTAGVALPAAIVGATVIVFNGGANPMHVYGNGTDTIDGAASGTGVVLTNAKRCAYICVAAGTWISAQLGVVSA